MPLPTVILTSVIRSAHQGDSHGGVYLVDLETGVHERVVDWNTVNIDWQGRGADRGLRGIAFHNGEVYIAASDEIFVFDPGSFAVKRSFRNPYLRHCHEISIGGDTLYLTSTGFDSLLEFHLPTGRFTRGLCSRLVKGPDGRPGMVGGVFDPEKGAGPPPGDTIHINSVHTQEGRVFFSTLRLAVLLELSGTKALPHASIPVGTHNARPFRWNDADHALANCTEMNALCLLDRKGAVVRRFPIVQYDPALLQNTHLPQDHARQGFGRGMCDLGGGLIGAGSSPSTVSVYDLNSAGEVALKTINLTMDIRNAVHGLEVWPFERRARA